MNQSYALSDEKQSIAVEGLKDVDRKSRIMVGMFANYQTHDLVGDLSHKGMFDESWQRGKDRVKHIYEHDVTKPIGRIKDLWDDSRGAYYKALVPPHKFGDDVLEMAEAGLINEHSFGYVIKSAKPNTKGGKNLYKVIHTEVTVVGGGYAIHGNTPLLSVNKAINRLHSLETFCSKARVSDETGQLLQLEIKSLKGFVDKSLNVSDGTKKILIALGECERTMTKAINDWRTEIKAITNK